MLFAVARVLAQQDVAPKVEHDQPHTLLTIYAAMPFPRRSSPPRSSYSGRWCGGELPVYVTPVSRLGSALVTDRRRGEFRVTVERKQNSVCRGATAPKEPGKPQRPADTQH
jgi:hypothetical protein